MNMKKKILSISVLVGLGAALAFAAGVPQKFPTDTVQLGIPGAPTKSITVNTGDGVNNPSIKVDGTLKTFELNKSATLKGNTNTFGDGTTADKALTFDTGDGVSNKKITLKGVSKDIELNSNTLKVGDGAASNKTLQFNKGANSAEIRYNNSSSKLEFTHDGTTYKPIGSGSGGGGGISLIGENNPGFEDGTGQWTNSGGGATFTTSGTTPGYELLSGVFNSSAASQTLSSAAVSIPSGLQGTPCVGSFWYKTTESTNKYKVQVYDGTNVLSETTLEATGTVWDKFNGYAGFNCPSSGTILLRIISTGDAADISLDQAFLGEQKTVQVGSAFFAGSVIWPATASCAWSRTSNASFASFAVDADCTFPAGGNIEGNAAAPATKVPAIKLLNVDPGRKYKLEATGNFLRNTINQGCSYRFSDGTVSSEPVVINYSTNGSVSAGGILLGEMTFPTGGDKTVEIQTTGSFGSTDCTVQANSIGTESLKISAYQYPNSVSQGIRADQTGWQVDASLRASSFSLGTSAQSQAMMSDASIILGACDQAGANCYSGVNPGSAAATVACSGTNASTGNTCSAGSEQNGLVFTIPYAGKYEACQSFTYNGSYGNASANPKFDMVETSPTNDATIISYGRGARLSSSIQQNINNNNGDQWTMPVHNCATFDFASAGTKAIRTIYTQNAWTSGFGSNAVLSSDFQPVHWTIRPINSSANIPVVFKGMVTTQGSGREYMERATVAQGAACTAGSCTINSASSSWITVTRSLAGIYNLAFTGFTSPPSCMFTHFDGWCYYNTTVTSSSVQIACKNQGGSLIDVRDLGILCQGAK